MEDAALWGVAPRTQPAGDVDRQLLRHVSRGDRQALAWLMARYQRPLLQYLLHLTPDRGRAEEILQDTFVAVWQGAGSFAGQSTVKTWLIGIARRQAHNTLRRAQFTMTDEDELHLVPSMDPEPEASALAVFEREALVEAMERLPAIHREVLVLAFVHGLSYQEIAEVVGVPVGTVRSRLSNAKVALRALLQPVLAQ